jgi:hypothetical protein
MLLCSVSDRLNEGENDMSPTNEAVKDYDVASDLFHSTCPHKDEFVFTGEEIADLVWNTVNATADAIEAGVDRSELRLRAASFVLRRYAIGIPTIIGTDYAWDKVLASARAARPGGVYPFPNKEGK